MKKIINLSGLIILIVLLFLLWNMTYKYQCFISLIFPLITFLVIISSIYEIKIQRRECFRECFFEKKSFISRILSGKVFIVFISIIISISMTVSTIYLMLDYENNMLPYLVFYIVVLIVVFRIVVIFFNGVIRDKYLLLFSKEITINISAFISIIGYFYILLDSPTPVYLTADLKETIHNASQLISSDCIYIDHILRLKIELDSTFQWFTHYTTKNLENQLNRIAFTILNALAILGINRFIVQIIYLQDVMLKINKVEEESR